MTRLLKAYVNKKILIRYEPFDVTADSLEPVIELLAALKKGLLETSPASLFSADDIPGFGKIFINR